MDSASCCSSRSTSRASRSRRPRAIATTRKARLFHWETQAGASVTRESGRRYVESSSNGWSFYLFVRTDPAAAFAFLGRITYERHEGDRPIAITWRLANLIPAALFDRYAVFRP